MFTTRSPKEPKVLFDFLPHWRNYPYHGWRFRMVGTSTGDAEAVAGTYFDYEQDGDLVTRTYQGGSVRIRQMIGLVANDGKLTIRLMHIYTDGRMASGEGISQLMSPTGAEHKLSRKSCRMADSACTKTIPFW